jgi:quercetin dioxygenase-like cupin family protein
MPGTPSLASPQGVTEPPKVLGLAKVETRDLTEFVRFSPEGPARHTVFESERLWSQLMCLDQGQQLGPITDEASDAVFTVVAGRVVIQVNRGRKRLGQWGTALVPAGSEVTVTNAGGDPAVIFVVAAPPPTPRFASG